MSNFKKAASTIKNARSILVATHRDPDGDAIGSMIAMGLYLKRTGKKFYIFSVSGVPEEFQLLPAASLIKNAVPRKNFDLVVGLDYSSRDRLGMEDYFMKFKTPILAFDHHPGKSQMEDSGVIDTAYTSTAEIVFDYFRSAGFKMDHDIAKALMVGLLTDTGFFKYTSKPESLEMAFVLVKNFGISISEVEHLLYGHQRIEAVRLSGKILTRVAYNKAGFNYSYVLMKDLKGLKVEEVSGVVDRIRNINKGKFALFLIEEPGGMWRGRLRSGQDKSFDLSQLAGKLGGGGHKEASGFRVKGKIDDIIKLVAKYARE